MSETEKVLRDIMTYDQAHYFGFNNKIVLGGVITDVTESSNPKESEKQYVHQKSSNYKTTGFANEFPLTMDMVKGDEVFEYMYELFYRRKVSPDTDIDHYIVDLWREVDGKENTYYARKIRQMTSITECNGAPGEQKQITGSLKGGEFVYGEFNVATKTFTDETSTTPETENINIEGN
ncbi:MAG: hypothetical protein J6K45_06525 [Clostridia bacterium]|nr:hypothetical protein [Clostridia bacterium]